MANIGADCIAEDAHQKISPSAAHEQESRELPITDAASNVQAGNGSHAHWKKSRWDESLFDEQSEEPLGPLANLIDIILVFACGLLVALVAQSEELKAHFSAKKISPVTLGKELPSPPSEIQQQLEGGGKGFESLGQVYRDPETGKLILIKE